MLIGAGALHPFGVLQVATPLPWFPPMPIAILIIEGMTAIHRASLIMLSGIALSGVAMISFRTLAAESIRLLISDSSLSSAAQVRLESTKAIVARGKTYFREFIINLFCAQSEHGDYFLVDSTFILGKSCRSIPSKP